MRLLCIYYANKSRYKNAGIKLLHQMVIIGFLSTIQRFQLVLVVSRVRANPSIVPL